MKNFTIKQFFLSISVLFTNLSMLYSVFLRYLSSFKNHAKKKEIAFFMVIVSIFFPTLVNGQDNPLAPAKGFNVISNSGGASLNQGDIDGGLATLGGLTLRGAFTMSGHTAGSYVVSGDINSTSLIVEGPVSYTSGSGMNVNSQGYIKLKDMSTSKYWPSTSPTRVTVSTASSQDANPRIEMSATQTLASINQDAFDFGTAFTSFYNSSDTYKNCTSNIAVSTTAISSYTFNLTSGRSNFFKINGSNLDDFNEIKFNIVPSATNPAIITVDLQGASTFNWPVPNFPGVPNAAGQYILFNFVNGASGATININGGSTIVGAVFAPYFKVNKVGSGNIEGQVVCSTYTHEAGEVHYQVFNTTVNCSAYSSVTCDCAGNLLLNPSFEVLEDRAGYSTSNRTKYWNWTSEPSTALYTWTGYPVCDTYNAYLDATGGAKYVWQKVSNVTVGTSYSLSAYAGTHDPNYDHRIRLVFYNSAGTALLTKEVQVDKDVDFNTNPPLQEYKLSGTAPVGTSYLRVEGYASADYLKLDNFCLTVDNTCNNVTSGGTIGSDQTLCKNAGATDPAALTNVTSPSGGDTGVGLEYQWYSSTILSNGACSTNMTGSIYSAIAGATTATYDPGAISQTTCYIRASRRVNCSDYVGLSNAVKVVVKNNCTVTACANNLVQNGGFETDNGAVNSTTGTKFPVSFMSSPASYITQTNGVNTTPYLGTQPQYWTIGTDVNDYLNKNGAFYIDASSTGNAYSGDRFIWGRVNQCLAFSLPNQSLLTVSEGKKYRICAYVAAFNPTSSVQGDAKFVFETYFRNANNSGAGLLDDQYNWKSATADADGKWETLGWQQVCQDVTAPAGATALGFYITPSDDEGDGLAVDDVCVTELPGTTPPTITNINKCGAGVSTITLGGCSGGTINWYDSMSNKTAFTTGASYTTPSLTVSKTYYVSCTISGSESMKVPVSVIVNGAVTGVSATPSATTTCGTAVSINGAGVMTNPNLVTNGSFTDGNIGFGTDYGFQNWTNGGYGVTTDASTYYTWAAACKDRTASGTGNIFVADGALDAAVAVWYQTIPVKANTTYRLSTYASSIGSSSPAVLAFYVNGVKVGTSTTLSTTTCQWQQITTTWSSGSATSALFEIRDENAGVGGNDFALDDISVTYENLTLTYSWTGPTSFTATTQNVSVTTAGTYTLTVSAPSGCTATASTTIATCPCPTLSNASPSTTIAICAGATIPSLSLTSNLAVSGTMIEWCAFTSAQTNPYTSTATMYCLQPEANVINGTITATNLTGMPTIPGTYYVYGCLKPVPTDASCRPFVSYIVTVTANPVPVSVTGGTVCATGSAQSVPLSATCITGATPTWYSSQTSTTALATATSYSPSISATTTYYVGCKLTASPNCETATGSRTAVTATVNPTPTAPTISVASGSSLSVCSGSSTTLTASACTTGSLLWSTGATSSSITVSPTVNTTYTATCVASSCPSVASNGLTVTVTNNVTNGGTIAGNQVNCGSFDPVAFTNVTLPSGGNGTIEYVWMKSTTASTFTTATASEWFVIIGANGVTYDPSTVSTTTYYIRCSRTAGCTDYVGESNIVSVTINPSQSVSATGTTKCLGETIQLSATSSTASSYSWSGPGTYTATLQNPIVTGLTAGTYSYTVTVTGTGGCTATANATVIINPIPVAPSVTGATICGSGSVNLSATCSTGQTAQWYSSTSSSTVLASGSTYSPSVSSTTTYYVGCKDNTTLCETAGANRTAVTATVNPTPTAPTISVASGSSLSVCSGSSTTLTASTCAIGSILWSTGATSSSITVSPTVNTTYTATCVASSCPSVASNALTVTVTNNVTNGGTIAGNQVNCGSFDPVAFTNVTLPSGGNGTVEYVWMKSTTASTFTTATASEWFVIIGANGATYDPSTVSTTTYYIRCSRTAGCTDYVGESNIVSVTINPSQSVSATGTTKCLGETIQLSATSSTASSYSWSGPGTYTATLQNSIVTGLTAGTYSYTVTVTGTGGCTATANATVIINSIPVAPSVTGATICGSGSINLSATCSTGQTAQWYSSTSSSTVLASGSTYSPSVSSPTTYYVGCKENTTLCETAGANRTAVTATVNSNPAAPTDAAGSKAVICSGESVTLSGTCVGGTAKWYEGTTALSTLTFSLTNTTNAQITKTYTVGCSVTSNGATCETPAASRATVTVKVNPIPAAPSDAKSDKTEICSGETITLSGTCLSGTAKWYDGATLVSNLSPVLTNTGTTQITKTYTVACSESNGATCETAVADRATVTIKVNPIPAKPTGLTPATTLCGSGSVDLVATCSLGKVNWYNGTTKLTTSPVASGEAFPVTVSATTTYTASCVDDSKTTLCETAPADRVNTTITVNSNPLAPTDAKGDKAVICSGESVTLSGTCVGGTAKWYEGTTALSSLTFSLTNTTAAQITKTYTVGCSVTSNGATCETPAASRATVSVKVNPIPVAPTNAKSDKTEICSGETITLSGTCLSGTAKWYDGTTLVSNLTQVLTNTTTAQTTKVFTVGCSESNGATCETAVADRATVTIKINPIPAKPTGLTPATTLCGSGSVDLVATCSLGKVNWYNGTTKLTTSPVASGVAFPVTVSATTTYTASCVDDSKTTLCETAPADRVSTTITVNSNPLAPSDAAGSKAVICSGESVTLSGTCVGGTAKWYEGTTALSSLTFSLTNTTTAQITKTYTVGCSVTSNGATCETPVASRATVSVKVNPIPAAPSDAKSDKTEICSGETITLSGTCLSGTAKWYDGTTLVSNLTQVLTNTTTTQITKTYTVGCSESNGATCETAVADRATVTIKVNPIPAKPTGLTPATTLCGSGSVDLVATCSLGKVNWYNGTTKLTTSPVASDIAFPVTVSATTTYTASCVDDSKTTLCETAPADRVSTTITVNSNPLAPSDAAGSKAVICSGESVTLSGTCVGGTAKWYEGTTALSSLTFTLTNRTTAQITKTYTVGCSVTSNGATCETPVASRATVSVKVNPIPAAPSDAKSDKTEICSGETITLSGTCLSGTAKWYDGTTLVSNLSQVLTNTGTTQITKTYTVGCSESNVATCETAVADRATVTVKVNPIPAKPTGLTPATTLCGSGSIDLIATCSLGKVNWYNGTTKLTTSPVASGVAFPVTVSATTTYTASCVDDSKTTLCETAPADRVSTTITVNSNPAAPSDAAGSKAVICSGESVTLSGTCVGGTAKWYEGTTLLSSLTFSLTNTTTAQITKTYTVGCSITSNGATCETPASSRATITVKVNPIPAAPTDAKSDKTEICSGETITLSGTCLSGTAKWYDGTTLVSNLSPVLTNAGTTQITKTYTVGCSESNGATCETAVADRATVTIKINPIPDSPTFPNGNEFVRCGEGDITVTASGCVGGTIKWYDAPSAGNLLGTGAYTIVGLTTTKDVYAECVSVAGCTSVDRVKATATVTKLPSTPVVTAVQRCGEGRVTFKATGCTNGTLVWYTAPTGGTALATNASYIINADSMYVANVLSSTSYYVECKIENSCVSATRGEAKVTITENVVEGGTIAADQAHCGPFDPVAFTSTSPATGGNGVVEYMWMKSTTASNLTPQNRSEWTVIDGAVSETYDSPTISTTTYFIRCSRTKGCTEYNGETNILKVTVNAVPTVSARSNSPVCAGSEAVLTAIGDAANGYTWTGPNGFNVIGQQVTVPSLTTKGTYKVTVRTDKGCIATDSITVLVNNNPEPVISVPAKICLGDSLQLSVSGGSTWSWTGTNFTSNVQSPVLKPTTAGTYNFSVTVSGTGGCTGTATTSVIVNALPVVKAVNDTICAGETGTLVASGASTYSWSGNGFSATGSSINVSQAGTYTVVGTDVNGCKSSAEATLFINAKPSVKLTSNSPVCLGSNAMLTATGDAGSSYVWSGSNGFSATGSSVTIPNFTTSGSYKVVVTSDKGCVSTDSISVLVNNNPEPVISAPAKICLGDSLHLSVSGGSTWSWTGTNFTSSIQSPVLKPTTAGTYNFSVTVSGTGGCTGTATTSVIVNALPVVKAVNDTICAGETGTLVASGASTYSWSGNGFSATGSSINVSQAGTYTVVGTDVNGCKSSAEATLFINAKPSVKLTSNSPVCSGSNAMLTATGDAGSSYVWSGSNGFSATGSSVTIPNFTTSGKYKVVVTSDKGCVTADSITVLVNNNPEPVISSPAKICLGDSLHLSVSGGSTWSWTGTNFTSSIQSPVLKPTTAGTYNFLVTVSGTGGCTGTATTSVIVNALPVVKAVNDTICAGEMGTLVASGASTYSWSGNGFSATGSSINVSQAGTYTVVGTDVNGCESSATATLFINAKPSVKLTSNSPVCSGSNAMLTATGDAGSTYAWSGSNGFSATGSSVTIPNFTTSGKYKVVVTSDKGCVTADSITVLVNNNPEPVISAPAKICLGDSLHLSVSGGSTWSWTGTNFTSSVQSPVLKPTTAGTYNFSVTVSGTGGCTGTATTSVIVNALPVVKAVNDTICAGETGTLVASGASTYSWSGNGFSATGSSINVSQAGTYTVVGTDVNGCKSSAAATLFINAKPSVKLTSNSPVCLGSNAMLTATGDAGSSYVWSGSNGFSATGSSVTIPNFTTSGSYKVVVTSDKGCIATDSITVLVNNNPEPVISAPAKICLGDSLHLSVSGGSTWSWTGTNFTSNVQSPVLKPTTAGTYNFSVTVSGTGGCTGTATTSVIVNALPVVKAVNDTICAGETGTLVASGASTYSWSGNGFSATGSSINVSQAGTYTVVGTDVNGCKSSAAATLFINAKPSVKLTSNSPVCLGSNAMLTATGDAGSSYVWSGSNGFSATGSSVTIPNFTTSGSYKVVVTSDKGCIATDSITVLVNNNPEPVISSPAKICLGDSLHLSVSGGSTWSWTGTNFTSSIQSPVLKPTTAGTYNFSVTVSGTGGCTGTATTSIIVNALPVVKAVNDTICAGETGTLVASGASTYSWSGNGFSATGSSINVIQAGTYTVVGTDVNGCKSSAEATLFINAKPSVKLTSNSPVCLGSNAMLTATGDGGSSYVWSGSNGFSATGSSVTIPNFTTSGSYKVVVTSDKGCIATDSITVLVNNNPEPVISAPAKICLGDSLHLSVSGGSTWSWTGTNFTSNVQSPVLKPTTAGTYNFSVTVSGTGGCTGTATTSVIVNALPVVKAAGGEIYAGDTLTLEAIGAVTYTWTGPNSYTATGATPKAWQEGSYIVIGTDANGCKGTDTTEVTIIPPVVCKLEMDSLVEVCTGSVAMLSTSTSGNFTWTGPNNFTATGNSVTISTNATASLNGLYIVKGTTSLGCVAQDTVRLVVKDNPSVQISGDSLMCAGGKVVLKVNAVGTYAWSGPNGFTSTSDSAVVTKAGVYTVSVTNKGCVATGTKKVSVDSISVTATAIKQALCTGDTLRLNALAKAVSGVKSITWTNGKGFMSSVASPMISNVSLNESGMYTVTAVSNSGCTATATVEVVVNRTPVPVITAPSKICLGDSIRLSVNDGKVWSWTGSEGFTSELKNPSLLPTKAGTYTYTVLVAEAAGCVAMATTKVIVNPLPIIAATGGVIYTGDTITLHVTGAVTYAWTGPNGYTATGATPKAWKGGIYTVIGTDSNGCKAVDTALVTVRPRISCKLTVDSLVEVCKNGTAIVHVSGADSYSWTGPNNFTATGNSVTISTNATAALNGLYIVKGITSLGCVAQDTVRLVVKDNPSVQISGDSLMCAGGKVVLKVNAVGTYSWSGPNGFTSTSDSAVVTKAGLYSVIVTNNGCVATGTKKVSVDSISVTATAIKQALCSGDTLRLNALAKAVSGVKSITWTNGKGFMSSVASPMISNVSLNESGMYTVTAVSNSGCTATATVEVVVNRTPVPVITAPSKICLGDSIHLSVNDGKVWSWTGSEGFTSELKNPSLLPTKAGTYTYTVLVAEAAGCGAKATANVIVNPLPVVEAAGGEIFEGDTLTLEAIGAVTYAWTGPNGYTATGATPKAWQEGSYIVIGTDANGCKGTDTTEVTIRVVDYCQIQLDSLVEVCKGSIVTLSTPTAGTYTWKGPNGFVATGDTITVSTNATTALNGWYVVTGETAGGCIILPDSVRLVVKDNPSVQISGDSLMCADGKVVLKVNAVGTYSWSGPNGFTSTSDSAVVTKAGLYSVIVTNNGCVATGTKKVSVDSISVTATAIKQALCSGDTLRLNTLAKAVSGVKSITWTNGKGFMSSVASPMISNVSLNESGMYTVTAVSNSGCTATATVEVVVNRTPVPVITAPSKICLGDSIHLSVNDGKVWSWTGSEGFTSELKNPSLLPTKAGTYTYTVLVAEAAGCTAKATANVIVNGLPIVEAGIGKAIAGDTVELEAIGANTYAWTGPNSYTATGANPKAWQVGLYIVTGIDLNGCKGTDTTEITKDSIVCRLDVDSLVQVCVGSTAMLSTTSPGTYSWTGPNGFTATGDTITVSTNATTALNGWYYITGTTDGGCIASDSVQLVVKNNPSVQITGDSLLCVGGSNILSVRAVGTYLWTGPSAFTATTDSITVTKPGTYTVAVTNGGCTATGTISVKTDSVQVKAITSSASICTGGTITLSMNAKATSGLGLISWTHGDFATNDSVVVLKNITSADAGWYVATVVSRGGCNAVDSVNVTVNPIVTSDTTVSVCKGDTATLVAPSAATYLWNTGAKTATVSADTAGVYTVQMTDTTGCISVRKFTVSTLDKPSATTISVMAVSSTCNGDVALNDGKITLAGTQSTERYDMVEGATYTGTANFASAKVIPTGGVIKSSIANPTTAVTYTVRIFNANDCYTDKIVTLQPVVCTCPPVKCAPYTIKKVKSARVN